MDSHNSQLPARADAARLGSVSPAQALRFRDALYNAGFLPASWVERPEAIELRARGGRNIPRLLRATAAGTPLDMFARLFLLGVPVTVSAARAATASSLPLEEWVDAGLLRSDGEIVEPLLAIYPHEGLLFAFDKPELLDRGAGADHVSGLTNSTICLAAFMVRRPFRNILDLGAGCGVLGFLAARDGGRLLSTDVNPRAVEFARFNARLNGIGNAEFAAGSAFEPARGRKFDLIVTNPPCVLGPGARYAFRDSGMELDALCRKIVVEAPEYLEEGGLLQSTAEWPNFAGAEWKERVSEWLRGIPCDALALNFENQDVLRHAEETVCETDVLDQTEQARLYGEFADYFQSRNVTSVSEGLIALRKRSAPGANWVRLESIPSRRSSFFGDSVWNYFAASDALERLGEGLFDVRLRMSPGLRVSTSRVWNGEAWENGSYAVHQRDGFEFQAALDAPIANLIRQCDGTKTLRELASQAAAAAGVGFDAVAAGCLHVIREMVRRGFLALPE